MEIWKDIKGYEGLYQVSNLGRVKRLKGFRASKDKILSNNITYKGYVLASLSKNGIQNRYYVHRLVADAFIVNPDNLPLVMHMDDNPLNNNVSNLKWGTYKDNMEDMSNKGRDYKIKGNNHYKSKINENQVIKVIDYINIGFKYRDIEKLTGVTYYTIVAIKNGRAWNWLTKIK